MRVIKNLFQSAFKKNTKLLISDKRIVQKLLTFDSSIISLLKTLHTGYISVLADLSVAPEWIAQCISRLIIISLIENIIQKAIKPEHQKVNSINPNIILKKGLNIINHETFIDHTVI
ncbi:MAG: hypothetical protein KQI35_11635 [Bacteroidetes bacterium]|nr:hypothetical protein [Bacteroidota bacterium]